MTNTTPVRATRPAKRRRTSIGKDAPSRRERRSTRESVGNKTSPAITDTDDDPFKLLGTRLEPIRRGLAAQPKILRTHTITSLNVMLDRLTKIKERRENAKVFTRPVTDKFGTNLVDKTGAKIKFVPNSCRIKNPIRPSEKFKDDAEMQECLLEAESDHAKWKEAMSGHAERCAKLEVKLRLKEVKESYFEYAKQVANAYYIKAHHRIETRGITLSKEDMVHCVAYSNIKEASEEWANLLGYETDENWNINQTSIE